MNLVWYDWAIIGGFLAVIIGIGLIVSRQAGKSSADFFLGGRSMPWWLLGVSMVACTFSCDTPNLVTNLVRGGGVVSNWAWWAFLITGMVTVFIYAQLWRRSKVMTDLEFYELRYSGKSAAFLRGFRSIYLGVLFNCLIMGSVTLAAIKIGQVIFGIDPWVAVVLGSLGVVVYATVGGIKSCLWADLFQYTIAMFGAVYAAIVACRQPEVGGLSGLLSNPAIIDKLNWMPDFSTWLAWVPLLIIPIAVQWWSVWYPGAEPGGGGYIAQRMLSAKNERHAMGATLFFNFMHYAMRPWPWIIVALASIICYPTLESIKASFPNIDPKYLGEDIAYPVMIAKLGPGLIGLVVASLIAAYMSTIGTHLNWGSSYVVNDFYKRFIKPEATEKELVSVGRYCTVALMVIAGIFALTFLENAGQAFEIMLLSGAGTGAIYLLRWFWWRINAWTEIAAMIAATIVAFWIVLGVGGDGTLKWYIDSSSVSQYVLNVDDTQLAKSITADMEAAKEKIETIEEDVEAKVTVWRDTEPKTLERERARLVYDKALKVQEKKKGDNTAIALLNAVGGIEYSPVIKAEDKIADAMTEDKTTYGLVNLDYATYKTAKATAQTILTGVNAGYESALAEATTYDDVPLVAAREAKLEAQKVFDDADALVKRHLIKYGKTVVEFKADDIPVWSAGFTELVDKYDGGVDAILKNGVIYVYNSKVAGLKFSVQLLVCVFVVTIVWLVTTLITKPADTKTLRSFYRLCHPGGPGWKKVVLEAQADGENIDEKNAIGDWKLPLQILCVFFGCVAIYASLFSVGNFVYGNQMWGYIMAGLAVAGTFALFMCFGKIGIESDND